MGFAKPFNGRMRDELLNETIFYDLDYARAAWPARLPPTTKSARIRRNRLSHPRGFRGNTATGDRLRDPDQLRRSPVAPPRRCANINPGLSLDWMNIGGHSTGPIGHDHQVLV